jgi:dethiobiotin synthetase
MSQLLSMPPLPEVPRLRGLFITGTDTGVGKTLVAGAIARACRAPARRVEVFKPVATGCRRRREMLVSPDAEFLAACADSARTLAEIAPVRLKPALAPNVAAERSRQIVNLDAVWDAYRRLEGRCDEVIVEGIGGLMCPITDSVWVIHLARHLGLPLVVVARAGLGTISHTLLTLHAARSAGLTVAGVVINRYPIEQQAPSGPLPDIIGSDDDIAALTNIDQVRRLGNVPVLAIVPDEPANSVEKCSIGPDTMFAISRVNWRELMR